MTKKKKNKKLLFVILQLSSSQLGIYALYLWEKLICQ